MKAKRILRASDVDAIIGNLQECGYKVASRPPLISVKLYNTEQILDRIWISCLDHVGEAHNYQRVPELRSLADWLSNNNHQGLLLMGKCGRGKTFFLRHVLPVALQLDENGFIPSFYTATEAVAKHAEVMNKHVIVIDDLGIEQKFNDFGTIHDTISEVIDSAEKKGKLLFFSTNLSGQKLREIYGDRNCDRLHKLCRVIAFNQSQSFRRLDEVTK